MNGESGADVYDRATAFWESVFRSMDHTTDCRFNNYVIVTHGLMMVSSAGRRRSRREVGPTSVCGFQWKDG